MAKEKTTEKPEKQAHDLAAEQAPEGSPAVENAAAARVDAMERVDEATQDQASVLGKTSGRDRADWHSSKTFTALQPINRSGRPIYPGEKVDFEPGEGDHVSDLLASKVIAEGAPNSENVKELLGLADLARGRALANSGL